MTEQRWKRNAAAFIGSQSVSLFGSSLVQFAITWYITLTTQSGGAMAISIACGLLPLLVISPFAGVWADRYNRKWLIMLSDGGIALATLLLAIVFLSGHQPLWLVYVIIVLRAVGTAIQNPTVSAMIPALVPEEQLTRINGINGSVQAMLSLAAPALAGVILMAMGRIELVLFLDIFTAAAAILLMAKYLHLPKIEQAERKETGHLAEMREGLRYIAHHRYLTHLLLYLLILCFLFAPVAFLTPLQVVRTYGEETWKMTASQVAFTGGMLAGGLLISLWSGFRNRIYTMGIAISTMGVCTVLMGTGAPFFAYLAFVIISGIMMPFFNTPATVMLQERVDPVFLGRVFSITSMVNGAMMPLGMLLFGPLSDSIPIELLLIVTGGILAICAFVLFLDKTVKPMGLPKEKKPKLEGEPA